MTKRRVTLAMVRKAAGEHGGMVEFGRWRHDGKAWEVSMSNCGFILEIVHPKQGTALRMALAALEARRGE